MNRAAFVLTSLVCLAWALVYSSFQFPAQAARSSDAGFQKLWADSRVNLSTSLDNTPVKAEKPPGDQPENPKPRKRKRVGSGTPPDRVEGQNQQQSERAVCRSQCSLERMGCDQGNNSFQNRSDQIQSAQQSCFLAVQSCLSRC